MNCPDCNGKGVIDMFTSIVPCARCQGENAAPQSDSNLKVQFVTNDGNGLPQEFSVEPGTTVEQVLNMAFEGNLEDFTFSMRPKGGVSDLACMTDTVENGCRLTVAPRKVDGAI